MRPSDKSIRAPGSTSRAKPGKSVAISSLVPTTLRGVIVSKAPAFSSTAFPFFRITGGTDRTDDFCSTQALGHRFRHRDGNRQIAFNQIQFTLFQVAVPSCRGLVNLIANVMRWGNQRSPWRLHAAPKGALISINLRY